MIGGTAMSFTAILFLEATPFQMGVFNAMQIAPPFLAGLFAGALVDRLRRRPLMIAADIIRALVLAFIPLAAFAGVLRIEMVYVAALLTGLLSILFDLAYQSYVPGLVGKDNILEGNSKLSATASAAEFGGFSIGGWLVQALGPPLAVLIDAASFLVSALTLGLIRRPEVKPIHEQQPNMRREIGEGMRTVMDNRLLRSSALAAMLEGLAGSVFGALVVLQMSRGLGFDPGVLGMIWAIGGISSMAGAALMPRVTRWAGAGRVMAGGLVIVGISQMLISFASGPTLASILLLGFLQLGDGFFVLYQINQISMRQSIISEHLLGRVNASMQFLYLGSSLVGTLLGGLLGEVLGLRPVLFAAACGTILAGIWLAASPVRNYRAEMD